jgi:hypothetical protein
VPIVLFREHSPHHKLHAKRKGDLNGFPTAADANYMFLWGINTFGIAGGTKLDDGAKLC